MLTGVDKQTGEKLSDDNIVAQCQTFLIAGHETTSGLLSFAISFLIKHPDVVARAQEEVDRVLGTDTSLLPTYQQVQGLTYVNQILSETLRLWPTVAAFTRYPYQDAMVGPYLMPKGSSITGLTIMLHRDPSVWGDDAEEFNPDHFRPETRSQLPPNAFKPFGSGQRACIGRQFAMQEAMLVLGMLLQRFEFVDYLNYELKVKEGLTIKPDGLLIKIKQRPGRTTGTAPITITTAATNGQAAEPKPRPQRTGEGHNTPLMVLFGSNLGTAEGIASRSPKTDPTAATPSPWAPSMITPASCRTKEPWSWCAPPTTATHPTTPNASAAGSPTPQRPPTPDPGSPSPSSAAATWTGPPPTKPYPP